MKHQANMMAEPRFIVTVCMYCHKLKGVMLSKTPSGRGGISHGICDTCYAVECAKLEEYKTVMTGSDA